MIEPQNEILIPPEIDADKKLSVRKIVAYLDKHLPDFPNFFNRKFVVGKKPKGEIKISQILCPFLNTNRESNEVTLFDFSREWEYENQRSSDFVVIDVKAFKESSNPPQPFFSIEAKRLPTTGTDTKTKKSRKKEYVEGNLGGVERYKRGHHAPKLSQSALIGYVQKETCSYWHTEINKWIKDLISNDTDLSIHWDSNDLLIQTADFNTTKKYASKNTRKINSTTDSIYLYHYLERVA